MWLTDQLAVCQIIPKHRQLESVLNEQSPLILHFFPGAIRGTPHFMFETLNTFSF